MELPSFDDRSIDEFVASVCEGDIGAFEVIVRTYERQLRAWLVTHSRPGIDVDEVAQRTFIAAYSGIKQYQLGTKFSSWLFTIARFQLQSEVTRLRRLADYHSKFAPDLIQEFVVQPNEDSLSLWEARLENLRDCLKQLGKSLQQYVEWRYEEQMSIAQIATASGRSNPAIKKQFWLIRQKLSLCIQERMSRSQR